jgi:hypothetical protein
MMNRDKITSEPSSGDINETIQNSSNSINGITKQYPNECDSLVFQFGQPINTYSPFFSRHNHNDFEDIQFEQDISCFAITPTSEMCTVLPLFDDEFTSHLNQKKVLKSQINAMRASMNHEVLSTLGVCPLVDRRKEGQIKRGNKCCGTYFYRYGEHSGCEKPDCRYDTYCANRLTQLMAEYMELLGDDEEELHDDDFHYTPYIDENRDNSNHKDAGISIRSVQKISGEKKRRRTHLANYVLDIQLDEDMGTSARCYKRTKSGKHRKEYYGR